MKNITKLFSLIIAIIMIASMISCNDAPAVETTNNGAPAETPAETPQETPEETPAETEPDSSDVEVTPGEPLPDGIMVYYEDFNSLDNGMSYADIISTLGWKVLFKNAAGVPAELADVALYGSDKDDLLSGANTNNSTLVSVKDGRLFFKNYHGLKDSDGNVTQPLNGNSATDSYFRLLDTEYMEACGWGDYTVQYEIEYEAWSDVSRYATMLLNYSYREDGAPTYCSSHLRVTSILNHEVRFEGSFMAVYSSASVFGSDKSATGSIAVRIFGQKAFDDKGTAAGKQKVTITIKAVRRGSDWKYTDPETGAELGFGYHIFVNGKLASVFNPYDANGALWDIEELIPGDTLAFKIGGKIDVYLDNVAVWTGLGDMPTDTSTDAYKKIVEAN